jgi:hypothetical protein
MAAAGEAGPSFFGAYGEWMQSTLPSWEDLAWLSPGDLLIPPGFARRLGAPDARPE